VLETRGLKNEEQLCLCLANSRGELCVAGALPLPRVLAVYAMEAEASALRDFVARHPPPEDGEASSEGETQRHLRRIYSEIQRKEQAADPTLAAIPRFYSQKWRASEPSLALKVRGKARRSMLMNRQSGKLLSDELLQRLYEALQEASTPVVTQSDSDEFKEEGWMNYDAFQQVSRRVPECSHYFCATNFLMFERDDMGRILVPGFMQFVVRQDTLLKTVLHLSLYDTDHDGVLKDADLEEYIHDMIPSLPQLAAAEGFGEKLYPFWVKTAVSKFRFFLDPRHTGRIKLRDLATSPVLDELFELRQQSVEDEAAESNWFSPQFAIFTIYREYLALDVDQNGMLSKGELKRWGMGSLTDVFIDCVFAETTTYHGEMDYESYLEFVLAMDYKDTKEALAYFFNLLDVRKNAYLTIFNINYFFREVLAAMNAGDAGNGAANVTVEDVKDEIFDMVKPKDPNHITLQDLIECQVGDTIVTMLIDMNGFWQYDNREALMAEQEAAAQAEQEAADAQQAQQAFDAERSDDWSRGSKALAALDLG